MSDGMNRVMLIGNLGVDPELKVTPGGQAVLKLRLATNESWLDKNKVRQERVEWHRVTVWGRRGEALAKFLRKGDKLFIEGRIQTSSYDKNGEKRYSTEIVATNVIMHGSGGGGGGGSGGGGAQRSTAPVDDFDQGSPDGGGGGGGDGGGAPTGGGAGPDDDIPF